MISILIFFCFNFSKNPIVAYINKEAIHQNELKQEMYGERTGVYAYFASKYLAKDEVIIWSKKYQNEVPDKVLKKRALKNIIEIKFQQILMKKYLIQTDISYATSSDNFKSFTEKRAQALKTGKIIYGPPQFSEKDYFDYVFAENLNRLKDTLVAKRIIEKNEYKDWIKEQIKSAKISILNSRLNRVKI